MEIEMHGCYGADRHGWRAHMARRFGVGVGHGCDAAPRFRRDWGEARPGEGGSTGRRRVFDGGEMRLLLLRLIADEPRHGYDLIRAVEERTAGAYAPSPGVIYPTLTLLDDMGLIRERRSEGARKLFEITEAGTSHLAERAEEVAAILARLDALGSSRQRTDVAPVRRAMHNLRSVLQNRLTDGLTKEQLHEAVALIDEAAAKIERLP